MEVSIGRGCLMGKSNWVVADLLTTLDWDCGEGARRKLYSTLLL